MRMTRWIVTLLTLGLLAGVLPSGAQAALGDRVGVYVDFWNQELDGDARIDGATPGDVFSVTGDAGLDGEEGLVELGAWFHPFGRHRFRVSGLQSSFEGRSTLTREIKIGDVPVPAGTDVGSTLDLDFYKAHYNYSVVNRDLVNFGVLVGVDLIDGFGRIDYLGTSESSSLSGAIPVVGANLTIRPIGFFRLYAEISGASWDIGGVKADLRDTVARAEFYTAHVFGVGIGYRKLDLEAEEEEEGKLDISMDGFQAYVILRF